MAAKNFGIPLLAISITERLANREIVNGKEFFQLSLKAGSPVEWLRCGYMPGKARKRDNELIAIPRKLFSVAMAKLYCHSDQLGNPMARIVYECPRCGAFYDHEDDAHHCPCAENRGTKDG